MAFFKSKNILLSGLLFCLVCPLEVGSTNKTSLVQFKHVDKVSLLVHELNVPLLGEDESEIPSNLTELVRIKRKNIKAGLKGDIELLMKKGMVSKFYLDQINNGKIESVRSVFKNYYEGLYGNDNQVLLTHIFIESTTNIAFIREQISGLENGEFVTLDQVTRIKFEPESEEWVYMPNRGNYYTRLVTNFIYHKFPYEEDVYGYR